MGKTLRAGTVAYGPDRNRYLKREYQGSAAPSSTTIYLGKSYERVRDASGSTVHKYFISTEDGLAAIFTEQSNGQGSSEYLIGTPSAQSTPSRMKQDK